ncbi:MAG TPA: lipoprotein [Dyella sp.]|uniref:LPS translocon maturation chaperone LptM n=1 Tax=Dyella sp. TaxID=1869338 RepID=UPI002BE11537|nr:lipoprotein [Dyella sp.]HTV85509.1 lipoprotein [Dyella sp.]
MRRSLLFLPACLALAALSGCGNKGPLYMPPAAPKPVAKPAPAPAPAASAAAPASSSSAPASASSVVTKPLHGG